MHISLSGSNAPQLVMQLTVLEMHARAAREQIARGAMLMSMPATPALAVPNGKVGEFHAPPNYQELGRTSWQHAVENIGAAVNVAQGIIDLAGRQTTDAVAGRIG